MLSFSIIILPLSSSINPVTTIRTFNMAKPTLETLPPEILHQIFKLVVAQKDE